MALKAARFLDPKTDVVFKKIFGLHPHLIKSFLNAVLPLPEQGAITEIEYLTPEQAPRIPNMKNTVVDVKCKDQQGKIFIVEMQMQWSDAFAKRLSFGVCKAYVQQLPKGKDYHSLCPVYGLGIINAIFDQSAEWYHHYKMIHVKDHDRVLEGLELVFIELPKFTPKSQMEKRLGVLWLRFLKELDEYQEIPKEFELVPELTEAAELAQESAYTAGELEAYDQYWDAVRVESTVRTDGFIQGEQIGLQKGRSEGRAEGKAEGKVDTQLEIARKLLEKGMPHEEVCLLTGVTEKDLK